MNPPLPLKCADDTFNMKFVNASMTTQNSLLMKNNEQNDKNEENEVKEQGKVPLENNSEERYHSLVAIQSVIIPAIKAFDPQNFRKTDPEAKQIWEWLDRAMQKHAAYVNAPDGVGIDKEESGIRISYLMQQLFLKISDLRGVKTLDEMHGIEAPGGESDESGDE